MNTLVEVLPSLFVFIPIIISAIILTIGVYILFLLIKALKIYIRKNS